MSKSPKYYIESNLSEKQIEADVATYMGWCTPSDASFPFRLLDVNEQATGADKVFDSVAMIYMQFKKSNGLQSILKIPVSSRKNKSPLEDIREFRGFHELDDNPTLFFQLRAKANNAEDFQHNVLHSYEKPPYSRAIYVAPLILDCTQYSAALFNTAERYLGNPFFYRTRFSIHQHRWTSVYSMLPFLREHVSIPPHERVASHNHYFAFSRSGTDISWHSPSVISREPTRLSDSISIFFRNIIDQNDGMVPFEQAIRFVEQNSRSYSYDSNLIFDGETAIEKLQSHGKWLMDKHQIRQFTILGNSEMLKEFRSRQ